MGNKTVIIYFSKDNNTRTGANILGDKIGAKVVELKEAKKGNFIQALTKKSSKLIGEPWKEIEEAENIFIMAPIWASNGVPAINAFLEKGDFTNKQVTIITFQQFKDLRNSDKVHRYIEDKIVNKKGKVKHTFALLGGNMGHFAGVEFISSQIEKVLLVINRERQ